MTDNVIRLGVKTRVDLPADGVLEAAHGFVDPVIVLGYDTKGEFYLASSTGDGKEIIFLLELARKAIMDEVTR